MSTKFIKLEIPSNTQAFTVSYVYLGKENRIHLAARDYEMRENDEYPIPNKDSMDLDANESRVSSGELDNGK